MLEVTLRRILEVELGITYLLQVFILNNGVLYGRRRTVQTCDFCIIGKTWKSWTEFKQKQLEALSSVVQKKNDTICLLPTGFGKSLIYQLLPFMFDFYQPEESNVSSSTQQKVVFLFQEKKNLFQECFS